MAERVQFHFDPACPWAWQGSRWIRQVGGVRDVEIDWRLFSLKLANSAGDDPLADAHEKGTAALRTLVLVRRERGNEAVGRVYEEIGIRAHDEGRGLSPDIVREALTASGLDEGLVDEALGDDSTIDQVRVEHEAAANDAGCFGVPTIVLASGKGMFGPVVSFAPEGERAGELWDHVRWLMEQDDFFELKRDRDRKPGPPP